VGDGSEGAALLQRHAAVASAVVCGSMHSWWVVAAVQQVRHSHAPVEMSGAGPVGVCALCTP
jgi:hypothetical protein